MNYRELFVLALVIVSCVAPPVDEKKKKKENVQDNEVDQQVFDVEYKRYLQEVVQILESDDEFKNRLMKASPEDIKSGKISKDLEFVNHHVRSKLDELKRQELERLRHLAIQQYEHQNGIDKKHMKIPAHVDPRNPHTFEAEDLRKLIVQTTKELDDADRDRREEFKEYEMNKELEYQEQLKHMDEQNRKEAEKQHKQMQEKHKQHPNLHHPGSKQQLEQVWEEQDHLSPEDFNPKTFFHLHDLDGNGVWDANEVKALFKKELDKMYDPNAPEDDIRERFEEMERMREHVFNETDTNKDKLISYAEFLEQTKRQEFEKDEGWDPIDQQPVYSQDEYKNYATNHEEEIRRMIDQGLIPPAPPGYAPLIIPPDQHHPGQMNQSPYYGQPGHPNAIPPNYHHDAQGYPAQGHGQPMHYQGQGHHDQQFQPPPQQYQQYQQQPYHGQQNHPNDVPHHSQGHPPNDPNIHYQPQPPQQQQYQPPPQHHPQQPPQQQHQQQIPQQQHHQQQPPQQHHQQQQGNEQVKQEIHHDAVHEQHGNQPVENVHAAASHVDTKVPEAHPPPQQHHA